MEDSCYLFPRNLWNLHRQGHFSLFVVLTRQDKLAGKLATGSGMMGTASFQKHSLFHRIHNYTSASTNLIFSRPECVLITGWQVYTVPLLGLLAPCKSSNCLQSQVDQRSFARGLLSWLHHICTLKPSLLFFIKKPQLLDSPAFSGLMYFLACVVICLCYPLLHWDMVINKAGNHSKLHSFFFPFGKQQWQIQSDTLDPGVLIWVHL